MKLNNMKEAVERLLIDKRMTLLELAGESNLTYMTLSKIIKGKTTNIRMSTIRQLEEGTGYTAKIEGDKILFFSPDQAMPELTKDEKIQAIKHMLDFLPSDKRLNATNYIEYIINSETEDDDGDERTYKEAANCQ
jgi:transcriptional regulator with XRE-family HTH domain